MTPGPRIALVAAEESGDRLGAALMDALQDRLLGDVTFSGVGGREMARRGLQSPFPIDELAIVGFASIPRRLPQILRRIRQTATAIIAEKPDILVIIDSPDFTHRVARRVRAAAPSIPIVDYVSPTVWAWRPGRARTMRAYVDRVLALLPFEPEAHRRLGGPPCTFVGHPLAAQVADLRPDAEERQRRQAAPPVMLVLPGSRNVEIRMLADVFGDAIGRVAGRAGPLDLVLPTVPHLKERVTAATATWPVRPRIVTETQAKLKAFRTARVALAKSGTVTLELALSGVPMVTAYRLSAIEAFVGRRLVKVPSVILANLVIGENVVPELLQEACTAEALSDRILPLLADGPERQFQLGAFARLDRIMEIGGVPPAVRAADAVLGELRARRQAFAAPATKL